MSKDLWDLMPTQEEREQVEAEMEKIKTLSINEVERKLVELTKELSTKFAFIQMVRENYNARATTAEIKAFSTKLQMALSFQKMAMAKELKEAA